MVSQAVLEQKQLVIDEIKAHATDSISLVLAHYRGMSVTQMAKMRSQSRDLGVTVKVVKNTLTKLAIKDTHFSGLESYLNGPVVLLFSKDEPSAAAKLVMQVSLEAPSLEAVAIGLESKVLASDAIDSVAKMPNKQQAIALLLGGLQAPVRGLACALKETYAKLVRTVSEVAKVKQT